MLKALYNVRGELLLGIALSLCAIGVGWRMPEVDPYEAWWITLLIVAALPHYAAATLALMAALQRPDREMGGPAARSDALIKQADQTGSHRMRPQ